MKSFELNEDCTYKLEMPSEYQGNYTEIAHKNIMITKD